MQDNTSPILVTGADRSGSTFIARILDICGVYSGEVDNMFENKAIKYAAKEYIDQNSKTEFYPTFNNIPVEWKEFVLSEIRKNRLNSDLDKWYVKSSYLSQMWKAWDYAFPDAKWIIVRRRSADIINSCTKTGYMNMFESKESREKINVGSEKEAWKWWIHQYESAWNEMITKGLNCKVVWPERMVTGDYKQIYEMLEWIGVGWKSNIPNIIDPLLKKNRR